MFDGILSVPKRQLTNSSQTSNPSPGLVQAYDQQHVQIQHKETYNAFVRFNIVLLNTTKSIGNIGKLTHLGKCPNINFFLKALGSDFLLTCLGQLFYTTYP